MAKKLEVPMTNLHITMQIVAEQSPSGATMSPLELNFRRMLAEKPIEFWREYHKIEKEYLAECKAAEEEFKRANKREASKIDVGTAKCVELADRCIQSLAKKHGAT